MSEIKVRLSLELPGSIMLSKQECLKNPKREKDCYNYFSVKVADARGKKKETVNVAVRKTKTVKQSIKLSKEAYDYMTSKDSCPELQLRKEWGRYTANQRLRHHCSLIADDMGALRFSFEVLND